MILLAALLILPGCGNFQKRYDMTVSNPDYQTKSTIYLAGGCFWGTEHLMKLVPGVVSTETGYANSQVESPTYRQVCTGRTGAAEAVKVVYDPQRVSAGHIIDIYLMSVDPLSLNRQGNDVGTQYRTGIFYTNQRQKSAAEEALKGLEAEIGRKPVIELGPIHNFFPAEDYHQDYLENNPTGYCHVDPRLFKLAATLKDPWLSKEKKSYEVPEDSELRKRLTPLQYEVTQNGATERPFQNEYNHEFRPGIYVDVTTGEPLFVSTHKFESGCGWPAFSRPISPELVHESRDTSHGMVRTEVKAARSGAHLGHVFNDGPREMGGLRYCINSASLRFVPVSKMEEEGYGDLIPLVDQNGL